MAAGWVIKPIEGPMFFLSPPSFSFLLCFCILPCLPLHPVTFDPMLDTPPQPHPHREKEAVFFL